MEGKPLQLACLCMLLTGLFSTVALADSRRVIEHQYDAAGHITSIISDVGVNPPSIQSLNPSIIRIGTVAVTAIGADLRNAKVAADHPGIVVNNSSTTTSTVSFDLSVADDVSLGVHTLNFTTTLGSTSANITVLPPLPALSVFPAPAAVPDNGAPLSIDISLSSVDSSAHTLNLAIADPTLATISPSSITIPAGQTRAPETITVIGLVQGVTTFEITSAALPDFSTPVFVTTPYVSPPGDHAAFSAPLGVLLTPPPPEAELNALGPFPTQLSVFREFSLVTPPQTVSPLIGPALGISFGQTSFALDPEALIAGAEPTTLTLSGMGLGQVTAIAVVPPDDISLGALSTAPDGASLSLPISADAGAELGERRLLVMVGETTIPPAMADADRILIASGPPLVEAINPIVMARLQSAIMSIHGKNLQAASIVRVTPGEGVSVGAISFIDAAGTELRVGIQVDEFALLGDRIVTVATPVGVSEATPSVQNTLSIVNSAGERITPVSAPPLGVVLGEGGSVGPAIGHIGAPVLGIGFGTVITGLTPAAAEVGKSLTVTLEGQGLLGVTDVQMLPADGVSLDSFSVAPDGRSIGLAITVALDAPQSKRRLIISTPAGAIAPAVYLDIVAPQPLITGLNPLFLVAGAAATELSVHGQNFDDTLNVRLEPGTDIFVSPPTVSPDGNSVGVSLSAAAGAATGPRVVVVETPSGITSSIPGLANTVQVVSQVLQHVTPITAPLLGIRKGMPPGAAALARLMTAPLVGIDKSFTPADTITELALESTYLGLARGAVAIAISPSAIPHNTITVLTIDGHALGGVSQLSVEPNEGISLTGPLAITPDGRQLSVTLEVADSAPQTVRRVVLQAGTAGVAFTDPLGDRLRIVGNLPSITSIAPIQELPGAVFTLTIQGLNLSAATSVDATPADGLNIAAPVPSVDGSSLSVSIGIDVTASLGPRVITVTTPAGTTATDAAPANTFTIVNE